MKPSHTHQKPQTIRLPSQPHQRPGEKKIELSDLEKLINGFQTSKAKFSHFIEHHLAKNTSSKRISEDENHHKNEQNNQQHNSFLKFLEETIPILNPKFHFNQEETQIIVQEALILCASMIEQYESHTNAKKSKTIKMVLAKSLLFLDKFLVQNIVPSGKVKISWILNQANFIFLQGGSPTQMPNQKGLKGKQHVQKSYQFQLPLLVTKIKIPFSFYLIFSVLQQKYLKTEPKNQKQILKQLEFEVHEICECILLKNENHEAKNLLVKTVCDSFGSFEFPVTYMFLTSIVEIVQNQMEEKYSSLNSETLHSLRLNREVFSLKNIELIFQALIKHQANSFNKFQITLMDKGSNLVLDQKRNCEECSASFEVMVLVELAKKLLQKQRKYVKGKTQKYQIRNILCPYCFTAQEKLDFEQLKESNFQNEKISFLMKLFEQSFWRQNFEISSFQSYKSINRSLLLLTGRCSQSDSKHPENNDIEKSQISQIDETQIAFLCLKTLFLNENQGGTSSQIKKRSAISIRLLKQKILGLYLIFLNSKSEAIRMETIEMLTTEYFLSYLSQNFEDFEISHIIQSSAEDYKNNDEESPMQIVKFCVKKLLFQIKNRLFDNCPTIQTKSMNFLLKLRSFYPLSGLKLEIFEFITQIFEQKLHANNLKEIPMEVIRMLFNEIENQSNFSNENRAAGIITAKHLINKCLGMSFSFFDFHAKSSSLHFHGDHIWQLVLMVRKLIEKMLWLVDEQQKQMKTNFKKLQYENFVICYLKEFSFTKTTINCFVFNDMLLEKLISMTELDHEQNQQDEVEIDKKQSRLLDNLKLILEELFEFSKEILKNPAVAKSMQKKSKQSEKQSKFNNKGHHIESKHKGFDLKNPESGFQFKSPSCNLNKIIKNIIRKQKKLNLLDCEILFLLIQKNILLNYESQNNITDTPSKIKRLILSLETTTKFNQILNFIEKEIKECSMESLSIYIKLYVVICIQINHEKKIQNLFIFYKNAYKYFKKSWLHDYHRYISNDDDEKDSAKKQIQAKNDHFFIRSLKTIGFLATEFQKFKKIQCITEAGFSQIKPLNVKDYSIFSLQTQQAINALDTFPQACFVELYQQMYDLLDLFLDKNENVPKKYTAFVKICLQILATITSIHPHLLVKINTLLRYLPTQMELDPQCQSCFLSIFENILSAKDSILMGLLSRSYDNVGYHILSENENQSQQKYQNLERFYKLTFYLLKEDMISIREVARTVFYGLFTKNKKINDWTKDYLDYVNEKGEDLNLFNDFKRSIEWVAEKLKRIDANFSEDKEFFRNVTYLTQINKQRNKKAKVYLQKDIRAISIRSTFIKKLAQIFGGDFDWLKYTDDEQDCCIILSLKIIQEQTELDIFESQELIQAMEKVIRQYYFTILRTADYAEELVQKSQQVSEDETRFGEMSGEEEFDVEDDNVWMIGQRRRMIFLVGQIMYTLIKLINEKKLKTFTKDLQKLIEAKKFNSSTINLPVNNIEKPTSQVIFNYSNCLTYINQLDSLLEGDFEDMSSIMSLTREFKTVAKKMYSILFEDEKPRKIVQRQQHVNQKKKEKMGVVDDNQNHQQYLSDFSQTEYQNSTQFSNGSCDSRFKTKGTKKFGSNSNSASKSNNNPTKKANPSAKSKKPISHSVPKKSDKRLMTIGEMNNDEEHVIWGDKGSRKSKRIMEKEEKQKIASEKLKQI